MASPASARNRWALLAVSAGATGSLFWSAQEPFGYWPALLMAVCLSMSNGFLFIASRLERSDVTGAELRLRQFLFEKI